jgi:hypothetical protein
VNLAPGQRLRSAADATEVIIVRATGADVDLRCGGAPLTALGEAAAAPLADGFRDGTAVGKRYVDDAGTLEVLVTKAGEGSLSVGPDVLAVMQARALPASV